MPRKESPRSLSDRVDEIAALSGRLDKKEGELAIAHGKGARGNDEAIASVHKQLAEKDSQLAKRFSEIAALTKALQETERSLHEKARELTATSERASRAKAELSAAGELAKQQKKEAESQLAERFSEIAKLTRLVSDAEGAARKAEAQRDWIREAASFLVNGSRSVKGRLSGVLPASWRRSRQMEQLKERGVFDAEAYLSANPDVAKFNAGRAASLPPTRSHGRPFAQPHHERRIEGMSKVAAEDIAIIKSSGLFDEAWYLEQYPDVRKLGMSPIEHYLWIGRLLNEVRHCNSMPPRISTSTAMLPSHASIRWCTSSDLEGTRGESAWEWSEPIALET